MLQIEVQNVKGSTEIKCTDVDKRIKGSREKNVWRHIESFPVQGEAQ